MSKLITIPIRKHTKVRRLSRWTLYLDPLLDTGKFITRPITDISKGLENPLDVQSIEIDRVFDEHYNNIVLSEALDYKNQKGDWNEWHKDMEEQLPWQNITKKDGFYTLQNKPNVLNVLTIKVSLREWLKIKKKRWLTRIKRIGRAKK